jgi:hypothetical protein
MSRLEDEEVNNIGSVIICCEAKPSPPVPLTKHSIKALVWSKKVTVTLPTHTYARPPPRTQTLIHAACRATSQGQERVTIGLRALSEVLSLLASGLGLLSNLFLFLFFINN